MPVDEPVVIVGAGPAGIAAANQLSLYGIHALVMEKDEPGGLFLQAGSVKNYPGAPVGITGRELIGRFPIPGRLLKERVTLVRRTPEGRYLIEHTGGTFTAGAVLVASGTLPVMIEIPGVEPERIRYGIGGISRLEFSTVAVAGGGDAALDYALTLSKRAEVRVYARSGFQRASKHLLEEARGTVSIALFPEHRDFGNFSEDLVVVACGRRPNVSFLSRELMFSPPGDGSFHLCGDCAGGRFRQASIAVGQGVRAAMALRLFMEGSEVL